jgi:hypothetical protein
MNQYRNYRRPAYSGWIADNDPAVCGLQGLATHMDTVDPATGAATPKAQPVLRLSRLVALIRNLPDRSRDRNCDACHPGCPEW